MSDEGAHKGVAAPIAASLAEFTEKLIARRGAEQANVLFSGQIGPATKALSARTNSVGVGDRAPDFSLPTAEARTWSLAEHLAQGAFFFSGFGILSRYLVWVLQYLSAWAARNSIAAIRGKCCLDRGVSRGRPKF